MTMSKPLIDTEICKSWQEQWKRSSTTFERMLVTFSSVFQLFILYANFCYFTRTLKNDVGRWKNFVVFITDFYYTIYIKENLKKKIEKNEKIIFPRAKLQHTAAFTQLPIGFGVWGKRSHWPCVLESLLLWGKSWVRLFILMTFNFYFFYTALFSQSQGLKSNNSAPVIIKTP